MDPTSAIRSPRTSISPGAKTLPVSMSSKRAACKTTVRGCAKAAATARTKEWAAASYIDSALGFFEDLFYFGLILLQQMLVGGFEAHHQDRLRVGGAQQSPAFRKDHADAVDVHGLVRAS